MPSLEDRIARLEDRAEIEDLVARYFLAVDLDDYDIVEACFTREATFAASGFDADDPRWGKGRKGIVAFLRSARGMMGQTVHTPDYIHLDLLGDDRATGTVTAHLELGLGETTHLAAVRYLDRYRREDGSWRIEDRAMKAVYVVPADDWVSALTTPDNIRWPGAEPGPSDLPRPNRGPATGEHDDEQ